MENDGEDSQGNPILGLAPQNDIALSQDGQHFYSVGGLLDGGSIALFSRDAATGRLIFGDVLRNGEGGISGLDQPLSLDLSSSKDNHLYVASGDDSALSVFSRDQLTGELTFVEVNLGLGHPNAVAGSPDGASVYVTSRDDNSVVLFSRDAATGELTLIESLADGDSELGLLGPVFTAASPDARHLYSVAVSGALDTRPAMRRLIASTTLS